MSEMIERVAKAIMGANDQSQALRFTDMCRDMARAAIEEMTKSALGDDPVNWEMAYKGALVEIEGWRQIVENLESQICGLRSDASEGNRPTMRSSK